MKFPGVINIDNIDVHAFRVKIISKGKITKSKKNLPQFERCWTVTPFKFADGYEIMHKACSSIGEVP